MNREYYYQKMLDTTSDYVFFKDTDGYYKYVSSSVLKLSIYDKKEYLIGKRDEEIFSVDIAKSFLEQDKIVLREEKEFTCRDWVLHRELGEILIETIKSPVYDDEGNLIGIQGIARDITRQYNAEKIINKREAELGAIFKTIPLPMAIKDIEGHYIYFNKYYRTFFGLKDNSLNQSLYERMYENDMVDTETIKELRNQDETVTKERVTKVVHIMSQLGDEKKYADVLKAPIIEDDGVLIGVLEIVNETTEIVKHADMIAEVKAEAEKVSKLKSDFIANVSHEIRTPMNGVLGFVQLLETTDLTDEQKDYIEEIRKSSKTMLELINNVLDLSKADAGRMTFERISFNIRDIVDDVSSSLVALVGEKDIEITSYIDSDIHENLLGDPLKLKQVLTNLTGNAVKFTEKGEIRIMVQLASDSENSTEIIFRVDDTGIGIKEESIEKIFGAFNQADSSTTRRFGGTGLGLAISKEIVEKMGGTIKVESEYGIGSSFTFNAKFDKDLEKENTDYLRGVDISNLKVILFNDNPFVIECAKNYLKETHVEIYEVSDPNKLVQMLESDRRIDAVVTTYYDDHAILSDELDAKVKKILSERDIPVFITTSRSKRNVIEKAEGYHFEKVLTRPVRKKDYYDAIYEYWGPEGKGNSENQQAQNL